MVHQLDLHELFDALQAEFSDAFAEEEAGDLGRGELFVEDGEGKVEHDLAQVRDKPIVVVLLLIIFCLFFEETLV